MIHLPPLLSDLAVILGLAGLVTLIFSRIRQPLVLGYIVAGLLVSPASSPFKLISDEPNIRVWADLGVIFLMFSLGLEFSFRKLSRVGMSALFTALIEVTCMGLLAYVLTHYALGWRKLDSVIAGAMLSISSTTIIIKTLDDLRLKTRRFAEMIFAILIVEDLIAIMVLVGLSMTGAKQAFSGLNLLIASGKLFVVVGSWVVFGYFIVPRLMKFVGRLGGDEMLTIVSLALCIGLAVVAGHFGYSVALGAFVMGSILAESMESHRISDSLVPIKNVFAAIFFVSVGMLIDVNVLLQNMPIIALFSAVVVGGKLFFVTLGSLISGQTLRTSVQVGMGMGQIGEFSFIIVGAGLAMGLGNPKLYPIVVAVSVITTFLTPLFVRVSHRSASRLEHALPSKVKKFLVRYAAWAQSRRADRQEQEEYLQGLLRLATNAIVIAVVFFLSSEMVLPRVTEYVPQMKNYWHRVIAWGIGLIVSLPFIWGMFSSFAEKRARKFGPLLLGRFATVMWIGVLSIRFFPVGVVLLITGILVAFAVFFFHKELSHSYHWFEERFLDTFRERPKTVRPTDVLRDLAPWDAHLVRIKVHPNSEVVGKSLSEVGLREKHGVNVVVIQRGTKSIVPPTSLEKIYPKDELLVLGTDEEVEPLRQRMERPPGLKERFQSFEGYELKELLVRDNSPLVGVTIKDSDIRERFGGMVVGIERAGERSINPQSTHKIESGDILWVVGETEKLRALIDWVC